MAKKAVKKASKEIKVDKALVGYIFGILAIVQAFFVPIAGVVLGIIGFVFSKEEKSALGMKAKKLSTIGLVLSVIFAILQIVVTVLGLMGQTLGAI